MSRRAGDYAPLLIGALILIAGTALGWSGRLVDVVVLPPPILRAALVGVSVVGGLWLFGGALRRLAGAPGGADSLDPDWPRMVRGIRLAFLGVAALAAAAGWVLGHPLPIVVALIIAGVDVIETSFLLLVARVRSR
jgi:hypothetical protein